MKRTKNATALASTVAIALAASASLYAAGGGFGHGPAAGMGPFVHNQAGHGMVHAGQSWSGHGPTARQVGYGPFCDGNPQARLEAIRSELDINDTQQEAWQRYVDRVTKAVEEHREIIQGHRQAGTRLPDRIERHDEVMAHRLASNEAVSKAFLDLYNGLTNEQKSKADQMLHSGGVY